MRILVVDDDYVSRTKLKTLLGDYGDVDIAPNGAIGLLMVKAAFEETLPYSLLTVDIQMPGLRGPEFVEAIKKWEKEHNINEEYAARLLMVTGSCDRKDLAFSVLGGADKNYVIKPITREKLSEVLVKMDIDSLMNRNKRIKISV